MMTLDFLYPGRGGAYVACFSFAFLFLCGGDTLHLACRMRDYGGGVWGV